MFSKMLKLTTVLFVLLTFYVVPVVVLSDGSNNGGGTPETNLKCGGQFDSTLKTVSTCTGKSEDECVGSNHTYTVTSESEGCTIPAYGWVCTVKKVPVSITTTPCKITKVIMKDEDDEEVTVKVCIGDALNATTNEKKFDDCSHMDMSQ